MKNSEKIAKLTGVDRQIIKDFIAFGLITPTAQHRFLACKDYEAIKAKNPKRSNSDIYFELSESYNVSESTIYKWVTNY